MHDMHKILQCGLAKSADSGRFGIWLLRDYMHMAHIFIGRHYGQARLKGLIPTFSSFSGSFCDFPTSRKDASAGDLVQLLFQSLSGIFARQVMLNDENRSRMQSFFAPSLL